MGLKKEFYAVLDVLGAIVWFVMAMFSIFEARHNPNIWVVLQAVGSVCIAIWLIVRAIKYFSSKDADNSAEDEQK